MEQVDIAGLSGVGSCVDRAATAFERAHAARAASLTAADALDGWASGPALQGTARAWGAFVSNLAGQLHTVGAHLSRAAEDYRAADNAAAQRVTAAGSTYGHVPR